MKLKDIIGKKVAVNCTTFDEIKAILPQVVKIDSDPKGWEFIEAEDIWLDYGSNTCFAESTSSDETMAFWHKEEYKQLGYTILSASEFIVLNDVEQPKFKVGDKVVPIDKTVEGYGGLELSAVWRKNKERGYIVVESQPDEEYNYYTCEGDYFNESDLTPYIVVPQNEARVLYWRSNNRAMIQAAYIEYCKQYDPTQALQKAINVVEQFEQMTK